MGSSYSFCLPSGVILNFENPEGFYPVNPYQSELLALVAVQQAYVLSAEKEAPLSTFHAIEWCAGNGPAAVALAKIGVGHVQATDVSQIALKNTKKNAKKNKASINTSIESIEDSGSKTEKFDLIAVNPPCRQSNHIPTSTAKTIKQAMDGGNGGLYYFKKAIEKSTTCLVDGGRLVIVLTSTMDVLEAVNILQAHYQNSWFAAPTTPILAPCPYLSPEDDKGKALLASAREENPRILVYPQGDLLNRLTWIIVAHKGKEAPEHLAARSLKERLPLCPYGFPDQPRDQKFVEPAARLAQTLGFGTA